jgi:hypothetical protein
LLDLLERASLGLLLGRCLIGGFLLPFRLVRGLLLALYRRPAPLGLGRSGDDRCQQKAAGQQSGGGAKSKAHVWVLDANTIINLPIRQHDLGSPTAITSFITSQAHKPEQLI